MSKELKETWNGNPVKLDGNKIPTQKDSVDQNRDSVEMKKQMYHTEIENCAKSRDRVAFFLVPFFVLL